MLNKPTSLAKNVFLITIITFLIILTTLINVPSVSVIRSQASYPVCTLITPPSKRWAYNSRSFCYYPTACITNDIHLPPTKPICRYTTSTLKQYAEPTSCSPEQLERITCAYSTGMLQIPPNCTSPKTLLSPKQIHYQNVILVPKYPYQTNIFHFSNIITTISHLLTTHPSKTPYTIIFTSEKNNNRWQSQYQQVIFEALRKHHSFKVVYHTNQTCFKDVLVLGRRGHVNIWPFTNTTSVTPLAKQIPVDSVLLRNFFYQAYHINHLLPTYPQSTTALPPLVLGYARRLGPGDHLGGNVHQIGTLRRFSETDERWFQTMLKEETTAFGVQLRIFTTTSKDSLKDQVTNFASLGACIGIHGANLVNTIFMPPLSVLIEVFPTGSTSQCYFAGANSGLRYFRVESEDSASAEESGCFSGRCLKLRRQRRVKIGRDADRQRVRDTVREGLRYLVELRERFPGGVPVKKDLVNGVYQVVD